VSAQAETVVAASKWISFVSHLKENRIEYLLVMGLAHLLGLTSKAYGHVEGMCV
jgi:hypothetical protein